MNSTKVAPEGIKQEAERPPADADTESPGIKKRKLSLQNSFQNMSVGVKGMASGVSDGLNMMRKTSSSFIPFRDEDDN